MDLQASATKWYERRGQDFPLLLRADKSNVTEAVGACRASGVDLVLIDTMPRVEESSVAAARVADLSVIPCGPSVLDIEAIAHTIAITNGVNTPGVIVINQGRHSSGINDKAKAVLQQYSIPGMPRHHHAPCCAGGCVYRRTSGSGAATQEQGRARDHRLMEMDR